MQQYLSNNLRISISSVCLCDYISYVNGYLDTIYGKRSNRHGRHSPAATMGKIITCADIIKKHRRIFINLSAPHPAIY